MGNYAGSPNNWISDVYQYDLTDAVIGGVNGIANTPLKNLADRTAWLKGQIGIFDRLRGEYPVSVNGTIQSDKVGMLCTLVANSGVNTVTLDDVTTFPQDSVLILSSFTGIGNVNYVQCFSGQNFWAGSTRTVMYMHDLENLILMADPANSRWRIINQNGNFYSAGEEIKSRKQLMNCLTMQGQELSRALYPRLWEFIQSLTSGHEVVGESLWLSDPYNYRGCFTEGNGVSTFRMPDERGMFDRMIDLGRGVDLLRGHNYSGGYEADGNKTHSHNLHTTNSGLSSNGIADPARGSIAGDVNGRGNAGGSIEYSGNIEATVKNIGKLNQIKY